MEKALDVKNENGIKYIQIDRPQANNKLSIECMRQIVEELDNAAADKRCHSVILHGCPDVFCSGGELGDYRKKSILEIKEFGNAFIALHLAMANCPKPIIAAVEGDAFGGGFSLVEACDLAVASETAMFAVPEITGGLAPAMGFAGIYANVPKKEAMALGLLGEKLSAEKACLLGMVNRVVPKGRALKEAEEIAVFFADANPTACRMFKELYADMGMRDYENRLRMGQAMMIALFKSNDGMEALSSQVEKREPVWRGE